MTGTVQISRAQFSTHDPRRQGHFVGRVFTSPLPLFRHDRNPDRHGRISLTVFDGFQNENPQCLTRIGRELYGRLIAAGALSVFWANFDGLYRGDPLDDRLRIEIFTDDLNYQGTTVGEIDDALVAFFAAHGYSLTDLRAFDAFPMTHHVECVALLS